MLLNAFLLASVAESAPTVELHYTLPESPIPAAVLSLASRAPQAPDEPQTFSYTFAEIGLYTLDVDDLGSLGDEDVEAYYLRGSIGLGFLHIVAGYENAEADIGDSATDTIRLGGGAHFELAPKLDLTGDIAWLFSDLSSDLDQLDDSDHGYEVRAGLRFLPAEWENGGLELDGDFLYRNVDFALASDDEQTGFEAGARLHFVTHLSLGAFYRMLGDDESLGVNLRLSL